jgi:hypothetical protein
MPETTRDDVESGLMGLTLVFARLNETTPERQMAAPTSARLAEERKLAGNLTSRAGVADAVHHISAATMTPSATGGTFICIWGAWRAPVINKRYPGQAYTRLNLSAELLE